MITYFKIDDFLPSDDYDRLLETISNAPMAYGSKSNSKTDPHGHWSYKPVHDNRKNSASLWRDLHQKSPRLDMAAGAIQKMLLDKDFPRYELIRCYVNAHTYGIDGYIHRDSDNEDELTAILYLCDDNWPVDWAGETVLITSVDGDLMSVLPKMNRLFVFSSHMSHCARAVSRKCNELRRTAVFKFRPRRSDRYEDLSQWLADTGALRLHHRDGTLHDHLMRVYQILVDAGHTHIAEAGGAHSVYGTNAYQNKILEPNASNRSLVALKVGHYNESLAFMFSVLDRPATLEKAPVIRGGQDGEQIMRRVKMLFDQHVDIPESMMRNLQLIECANLQDQDQNWRSRYPGLAKIWEDSKREPT